MLKTIKCLHIGLLIALTKCLVVALCRHFYRDLSKNNHFSKNLHSKPRGQMVNNGLKTLNKSLLNVRSIACFVVA